MAAALLIAFLDAEMVASLLHRPLEFHLRAPGIQAEFEPYGDAFPGVTGVSRHSVNAQGLRGSPWPDNAKTLRILCLGGGTTECLYLDDDETWPALLAKRLNEDVKRSSWAACAGFGGLSLVDHLKFARECEWIGQFDVVVCMVGAEDCLRCALSVPQTPPPPVRPHWARSSLRDYICEEGLLPPPNVVQADRDGRQFLTRLAAIPKRANPLDPAETLDTYTSNLVQLIQSLQGRGIRLVFVTQPTLWDDALYTLLHRRLTYGSGELAPPKVEKIKPAEGLSLMDRFNQRLADVCQDRGVELVDLAIPMNGRGEYFYNDIQFSEEGCRFAAQRIAEQIENPSLPRDFRPKTIHRRMAVIADRPTLVTFRAKSVPPATVKAAIVAPAAGGNALIASRDIQLSDSWREYRWLLVNESGGGRATFVVNVPDGVELLLAGFQTSSYQSPSIVWHVGPQGLDAAQYLDASSPSGSDGRTKVVFKGQAPGDQWAMFLFSEGFSVFKGTTYEVSLTAKAAAPRDLHLLLVTPRDPKGNLGFNQEFKIGSDEQTLRWEFVASGDDDKASLLLLVNQAAVDFEISNFELSVRPKAHAKMPSTTSP